MRLLRNLARRKLRTGLTIAGITIGMWALVVFSSMANKIDSLVAGGADFFAGKVVVTDTSGESGSSPMDLALVDALAGMDGVAHAYPRVVLTLDPDGGTHMSSDVVIANEPVDPGLDDLDLRFAQGRALTDADEGRDVVVLGSNLADRLDKGVGDTVEIRGRTFSVVGVLEPTLTIPDTTASIPFRAGQELFAEEIPAIVRARLGTTSLASQIVVHPTAGTNLDELAARIEAAIPNVHGMTPSHFEEQVGSDIAIFNALIVGVALISLAVGGLSVINTMAMSVQERTREIGIKRAIGGSRGRVVRELVAEAGAIGLIGGLLGLSLGALIVGVGNELGRASGAVLFELTPETAFFAVAFSTILGMAAGIVPAWSAARLDPVLALRHD